MSVVTGKHDRSDAKWLQLTDSFGAFRTHLVDEGESAHGHMLSHEYDSRLALTFKGVEGALAVWRAGVGLFNESMVAEAEPDIDDETLDPAALQRRERHDFAQYFTCHVITCFFEMANALIKFLHYFGTPIL